MGLSYGGILSHGVWGARNRGRDSWFVYLFVARETNGVIHPDLQERNGRLGMACHR